MKSFVEMSDEEQDKFMELFHRFTVAMMKQTGAPLPVKATHVLIAVLAWERGFINLRTQYDIDPDSVLDEAAPLVKTYLDNAMHVLVMPEWRGRKDPHPLTPESLSRHQKIYDAIKASTDVPRFRAEARLAVISSLDMARRLGKL
jgi:hypothetical protein